MSKGSISSSKQDSHVRIDPSNYYKDFIINEDSTQNLIFNIMSNSNVQEVLYLKSFRIIDNTIEAKFNREYHSSMIESPDHLIFISALINLQKMLYIYMCNHLGIKYRSNDQEKLKVWPTDLSIKAHKLVTKSTNIYHKLLITDIRKIDSKKYLVNGNSSIEDKIRISGRSLVHII